MLVTQLSPALLSLCLNHRFRQFVKVRQSQVLEMREKTLGEHPEVTAWLHTLSLAFEFRSSSRKLAESFGVYESCSASPAS